MKKPTKHRIEYYDYYECCHYLEEKYGYEERDYGGQSKFHKKIKDKLDAEYGEKWFYTPMCDLIGKDKEAHEKYEKLMKKEPEYLDFWYWVVKRYQISNGGMITFCEGSADGEPDWIKTIYDNYIKEFADEEGEILLMTSW